MIVYTEDDRYDNATLQAIEPRWLFFSARAENEELHVAVPVEKITAVEFDGEAEALAFQTAARVGGWIASN